jgi:hypothetical protein
MPEIVKESVKPQLAAGGTKSGNIFYKRSRERLILEAPATSDGFRDRRVRTRLILEAPATSDGFRDRRVRTRLILEAPARARLIIEANAMRAVIPT